jgi:uncharacterized protein YukE
MAQLGADVDALEQTAGSMTTSAGQIETIATTLTNQLKAVWWKGTDHDRFVDEWDGRHYRALVEAAQAIAAAAVSAKAQATAQRDASA